MYRTCLFCHTDLGANETLELLPVGRRVAFDGSKGRMWVVCGACGRWNLTPLEERWEAVEQAERAFELSAARAATENIALARARDGMDLVRIGRPERIELATWRYGGRLRVRRAKQYAYGGAVAAASVVMFGFGGVSLLAAIPGGVLAFQVPTLIHVYRLRYGVVARVDAEGGKRPSIRGVHLHAARLENLGDGHRLIVKHDGGRSTLEGQAAIQVASRILVRLNTTGASKRGLADAMSYLGCSPTNMETIAHVSRTLPGSLVSLPNEVRLAMEIATQEESERQALANELASLEEAWKEAEEIASIADTLLLPSWLAERLDRLRPSGHASGGDGA